MIGALVMLAMTAPAVSAPDIELMPGTSETSVIEPLFDPSGRWVPGDVHETSLTVRNGGPTSARVRFTVDARGHEELAPDGALELSARIDDGPWRLVDWSTWSPAGTLAPGETVPVDLRASFDAGSGDVSQDRRVDLDIRWQAAGSARDPGDLPRTGAGIPAAWIIAGLLAAAVGAAVHRMKGERS